MSNQIIREYQLPNVDNSDSTDDWVDWFTTGVLDVIPKLEATWSWNDQGWGNQKGTIRVVLVRNDSEVVTLQIGGIAPHDRTDATFVVTDGDLIQNSQPGDKLKFQYLVGGGGGHSLTIENFLVKVFERVDAITLPDVDNSDSIDDWIDWFTTGALPSISKIEATWNWNDQGWGNQKGTIRVVLVRNDSEVATLQLGPIAGHEPTTENVTVDKAELISQSQDGDVLKFQYLVGGGGGHTLRIDSFVARVYPRSSLVFKLPEVDNSDSTDDWVDWFTTGKLTAAIKKIEADWTWRDQGWGNQKGTIRVALLREDQQVATVQIGGIAPHDDTAENFSVTEGGIIDQSTAGDVLNFQYLVGGGGGHQLFINPFVAKIYL